jgi:predicted PolB exonuclease-like 3'-5' exonuclease
MAKKNDISKIEAIAFDIETIADESVLAFLPEVKADTRLKDPEKIVADVDAKRKKQREEMGLNPTQCIVCAFGWCDGNNSGAILMAGNDERSVLMSAWEIMNEYDRFVSFNGANFDLPIMKLHSLRRKIMIPMNIKDQGKYSDGNHIDLRGVLTNYDRMARGNLDFFLQYFFGEGEGKMEGIDGGLVQNYWEMELFDDIKKYVEDDAKKTWKLYDHVNQYL